MELYSRDIYGEPIDDCWPNPYFVGEGGEETEKLIL